MKLTEALSVKFTSVHYWADDFENYSLNVVEKQDILTLSFFPLLIWNVNKTVVIEISN